MTNKNSETSNREQNFTLIKLLHLIAALQFCFAVYYDFSHVHVPPNVLKVNRTSFGGKFKYLTFLDGVIFAFET